MELTFWCDRSGCGVLLALGSSWERLKLRKTAALCLQWARTRFIRGGWFGKEFSWA